MANFGIAGLDWQQRVNWERLRNYRLERARERMKAHGLGAMLLMYDENVRYVTGTLTPGWNRLKPGLRYAMLCGDDKPVLFEQGDLGFQIERHSPWIPKENVRYSYAWIKGAAGPASSQQVKKFTNAREAGNEEVRRRRRQARRGFHRHQHAEGLRGREDRLDRRHDGDDGGARGQERRRAGMPAHGRRDRRRGALGIHESTEARHHREQADGAHHGVPLLHPGHGGRRGRDRVLRARTRGPTGATSPTASSSRATSCSWTWPRSPGTATSRATTAPTAPARSRPRTRKRSTQRH